MTSMTSAPRRSRLALALPLAALLNLTAVHAASAAMAPASLLALQLVDRDSGVPLPQYASRGHRFSPGSGGARYAVRLSNRSAERLLVVLSVDGINAVTGDTAAWGQAGYVLAPGETAEITGWRKSDRHVAAFEFTDLADSYAARTGRPAQVGVVGAAVFREQPPAEVAPEGPPIARLQRQDLSERAAPAAAGPAKASPDAASEAALKDVAPAARAKLGTGHGASEWAPIQHTVFARRSSQPDAVFEVHYDSPANLMAAGIMPRPLAQLPRPFPGSGGYVPDPPARW